MSHYLHRAFATSPDVYVLNGLRLEDPEQPEHTGAPGVCQIDHLLVHRFGMFIIESKSISERVKVRDDGAGGDEWTRTYNGREKGFASPIQQARRQGALMRALLERHRKELLGHRKRDLRTVTRMLSGNILGFRCFPIQIVVAISNNGIIERINGWTEPNSPFRTAVCKADLVADRVRAELKRHHAGSRLLAPEPDYGLLHLTKEQTAAVAEFLAERHKPLHAEAHPEPAPDPEPLAPTPAPPACRHCGSTSLVAHVGIADRGAYWNCANCKENTRMPTICTACGAEGRREKTVRIHKRGPEFFRHCDACGIEERVWLERSG